MRAGRELLPDVYGRRSSSVSRITESQSRAAHHAIPESDGDHDARHGLACNIDLVGSRFARGVSLRRLRVAYQIFRAVLSQVSLGIGNASYPGRMQNPRDRSLPIVRIAVPTAGRSPARQMREKNRSAWCASTRCWPIGWSVNGLNRGTLT